MNGCLIGAEKNSRNSSENVTLVTKDQPGSAPTTTDPAFETTKKRHNHEAIYP